MLQAMGKDTIVYASRSERVRMTSSLKRKWVTFKCKEIKRRYNHSNINCLISNLVDPQEACRTVYATAQSRLCKGSEQALRRLINLPKEMLDHDKKLPLAQLHY